jgi:hypothetical protein
VRTLEPEPARVVLRPHEPDGFARVEIKVENHYGDDVVRLEKVLAIPVPEVDDAEDEYEEWAEEHLYPETGTGRTEGDACYFVTITRFDERPDLVGREFEWGV